MRLCLLHRTNDFCENACVAVRICRGGFIWEDDAYGPGQWMRCDDPASPVIAETANASQFASPDDFREAVVRLAPSWDGAVMKDHSLYGMTSYSLPTVIRRNPPSTASIT